MRRKKRGREAERMIVGPLVLCVAFFFCMLTYQLWMRQEKINNVYEIKKSKKIYEKRSERCHCMLFNRPLAFWCQLKFSRWNEYSIYSCFALNSPPERRRNVGACGEFRFSICFVYLRLRVWAPAKGARLVMENNILFRLALARIFALIIISSDMFG